MVIPRRMDVFRTYLCRFLLAVAITTSAVFVGSGQNSLSAADLPNIVVMLADDMGFGELSCLNPERGKIATPQLDALAADGMIFTDAHGGSSVCTPTRYGLLTGRYAWRTKLQSGVLTGGESLIAPNRLTLPRLLKAKGYHTAIVGKWHLGMLFDGKHVAGDVPDGSLVTHGPIDRGGFDYFRGFHHARQIRLWIEDTKVTRHIEPVEMLPELATAAVDYIEQRDKSAPFFLYVPWSSPHSPVVPSPQWQGRSGLNEHADFVMQTDDCFGQVVDALRRTGHLANTLIICSSDNGTSAPTSKMAELEKMGHFPSETLRGSKADIWDGGHRVPFIATWPNRIQAGQRCADLVCFTDVLATLADIVGLPLPHDAAEDSFSFKNSLLGIDGENRESVVHHSVSGYFAYRKGPWKLCLCAGSGGWTAPKPSAKNWKALGEDSSQWVQLYDMHSDRSEQRNVAAEHPDLVASLLKQLESDINMGGTRPGVSTSNDSPIVVQKRPKGL